MTVLNWDKYQSSGAASGAKLHQEVHQEVHRNKNKRRKEEKRLSVSDSDLSDLKSFLIKNGFENVADEVIETCERYGLDNITNLKNFALAVAKEKKDKKKPVPIAKKKEKASGKMTKEEKERLIESMERLGL